MLRVTDETAFDQNKLNIEDIAGKISEERGPYQNVFLQEREVMNVLINEIVGSLKEIELSFKGELTMTEKMEQLMDSIYLDKVSLDPILEVEHPSNTKSGDIFYIILGLLNITLIVLELEFLLLNKLESEV
jgi:hypothetical protein